MKKIYLVLFVILSVFVFSCKDNLISDDLSSSQNSGAGQVKVFVKQSRLIGPDVSDVDWTVELYKENDKISGKNENGYYLFSGLSDGTYKISVSGKIDEVEKFTGSAKVTITNGNSVSVNVPIVAQKGTDNVEATGYATITMDMSEELLDILYSMGEGVSLVARLFGIDDTNTDFDVTTNLTNVTYTETLELDSIDIFDNQQITFAYTDYNQPSPIQTTDIPAGYYNLSFVGLEEFGIKLKDNLVEIGDGLTTNIVLTQNDYEIVEYYSSILYVNNEGGETADGKTLSNPIAFSTITERNYEDLIYLLSDVDFVYDTATKNLCPNLGRFFGTISSFDSTVRTISANISDYSNSITLDYVTTLKNIKLSGSNAFYFESLNIDETVILDCNLDAYKPVVCLSKSSNLVVGKNFSGDLYVSLFGDWKLGDTVINFENGKPENSNFYIDSECGNSSGQNYSSMFYIDDSGKLAKYTDDFTSFAWNSGEPCLITQTQAKNKTYTSIYDSNWYLLDGFNGISTYDEDSQTWYFINNSADSSALYSVTNPKNYEGVVDATLIEIDSPVTLSDITAMDYDDGKLYMGFYGLDCLNLCVIETSNGIGYLTSAGFDQGSNLTALLVDGDDVYMATKNSYSDNSGITHSAIWKYTLSEDTSENGVYYNLIPAESYVSDEVEYPVPYYLTQYDDNLTINNSSFPEGSTFRITDLYIDGTEVYGLLANYGSVTEENSYNLAENIHLRGSIFKLGVNSDDAIGAPKMTATHSYLRDTLVVSGDYNQDFILPRKIVGIYNRKLFIADDGLIPDGSRNLNRFSVFDLDTAVSEFIEVSFDFSVSSASSAPFTVYGSIYENIFN